LRGSDLPVHGSAYRGLEKETALMLAWLNYHFWKPNGMTRSSRFSLCAQKEYTGTPVGILLTKLETSRNRIFALVTARRDHSKRRGALIWTVWAGFNR
jgi:hypothetical protein